MDQIDALLMQINSLVDNIGEGTSADLKDCAGEIQRMAANLPKLIEQAKAEERDRCRVELLAVAKSWEPLDAVKADTIRRAVELFL